jgi:hypothetical protein
MSVRYGHCLKCEQPIRPPFLSFKVMRATGDGANITEWEEIDVCNYCADHLTANDLHLLVSAEEVEP